MADSEQALPSNASYEEQLRAANEIVYKHSLELARLKQALEIAYRANAMGIESEAGAELQMEEKAAVSRIANVGIAMVTPAPETRP